MSIGSEKVKLGKEFNWFKFFSLQFILQFRYHFLKVLIFYYSLVKIDFGHFQLFISNPSNAFCQYFPQF